MQNVMHDGQPQAGALAGGLGRVKEVEDFFLIGLGDAHAVVFDADPDMVVVQSREDFNDAIIDFFEEYASDDLKRNLRQRKSSLKIKYLDYDWSLNGS